MTRKHHDATDTTTSSIKTDGFPKDDTITTINTSRNNDNSNNSHSHLKSTKQPSSSSSFYNAFRIATILRCWILFQFSSSTSNNHFENNLPFWIHHSSNLQSIWIQPMYTLQYIQRAQAIRQLSSSSSTNSRSTSASSSASNYSRPRQFPFANAYSPITTDTTSTSHPSSSIQHHLPPLVLFLLETIMNSVLFLFFHSDTTTNSNQPSSSFLFLFAHIFLLFIDGIIAIQLYQIVSNLLSRQQQQDEDDDNDNYIDNDVTTGNKCGSELHIMTHDMNPKLYPSYQMLQLIPISSVSTLSFSNNIRTTTMTTTTGTSKDMPATNDSNSQNSTPKKPALLVSSLIQWKDVPTVISLLYYINPITILSSIAAPSYQNYNMNNHNICFQNIIVLLIIHTIYVSTRKRPRSETSITYISFLLSMISYIDCHYMILVIPIALLMSSGQQQQQQLHTRDSHSIPTNNVKQRPTRTVIVPMVLLYTIFTLLLHALAGCLVGYHNYYTIFVATHLDTFRISNLQPNLSLLWYFGMEVFVPFHRYFTFLLGGLPYFTIIPMTIRLYQYPSVLVQIGRAHV